MPAGYYEPRRRVLAPREENTMLRMRIVSWLMLALAGLLVSVAPAAA